MANEHHLNMLKKGVTTWNQWRKDNPDISHPDLSWSDLSKRNLMWANLQGCVMEWAKLDGANLIWANLTGTNLHRATLVKVDLSTAIIDTTDLRYADLSGAYFHRLKMINTDLEEADLSGARFEFCEVENTSLRYARLKNAAFLNSKLNNVNFSGADLRGMELTDSELIKTRLKPSRMLHMPAWQQLVMPASLFILFGMLAYFWLSWRSEVFITLPKNAAAYLFFDNELIEPISETETDQVFRIREVLPGQYPMMVYPTPLESFTGQELLRFKHFSDTLDVKNARETYHIRIHLDTLYSVREIAAGINPNISPDGRLVIYMQQQAGGKPNSYRYALKLYDLITQQETLIQLQTPSLYDWKWDWDRPFLRTNGQYVFLSAFNHEQRQSHAFRIHTETGDVTEIPLQVRRSWLKYLPMDDPGRLIIENKFYSLEGKYLRSMNFSSLNNELFYGGSNGFVILSEENAGAQSSPFLECTYVDYNDMQAKVLFEVSKAKPPFISAANDAQRVVLTRYDGITAEFDSIIQLWSEGVFVNLTNIIKDGERHYDNGERYHKTAACADDAVDNIVYEYEGKVYLIHIPEHVTIRDFIRADMPGRLLGSISAETNQSRM